MPQLLALDECLGTSSGDGGLTIEGIDVAASTLDALLLPSEKRPRFFLRVGADDETVAKLAGVGLEGPAAAQ